MLFSIEGVFLVRVAVLKSSVKLKNTFFFPENTDVSSYARAEIIAKTEQPTTRNYDPNARCWDLDHLPTGDSIADMVYNSIRLSRVVLDT